MPRPDVSQERTHQILDAAMKVFSKRGINKARMDDIAHESGLSKGTLYLYFKSKDSIISTILADLLTRELVQAQEMLDSDHTATQKILLFTEIVVLDLKRLLPLLPLYFELMAVSMRRKTIKEVIKHTFRNFMDMLKQIIQEGVVSGEFKQVDVHEAALAVGAIFEGTILLWAYDSEIVDLEKHIEAGISILLEGLKA